MPGMTPGGMMAPGMGQGTGKPKPDKKEKEEPKEPPFFSAPKYTFVLQFCWQEQLLTERLRKRQQEQIQQQLEQQQPTGQPEQPPGAQPQPATPDNKVAAANTGG